MDYGHWMGDQIFRGGLEYCGLDRMGWNLEYCGLDRMNRAKMGGVEWWIIHIVKDWMRGVNRKFDREEGHGKHK